MIAGRYETCHRDRITKFTYRLHDLSIISTDAAQPENEEKEPISASFWTTFTGSVYDRIDLLQRNLIGATHSVY